MHFSYVKSNILRKWLKMLRNYVHARTFLLRRSIPLRSPGPPPDQARHPTRPATPPCPPPHPAGLHSRAVLPASSATTASLALRRACAVLALLQRLCVCGASKRATPSNILHTPSNILRTPSDILRTPSKILHTPSKILHNPSKILHKSCL